MIKNLTILILVILCFCSCGQKNKSTTSKVITDSDVSKSTLNEEKEPTQIYNIDQQIYTDTLYPLSSGKGLTIQNSFPKGGFIDPDGTIGYTDFKGKKYAIGILWTRIINETTTPLEIRMNFPAPPLSLLSNSFSYLKLFLPPNPMTIDKLPLFNFGIPDLKFYLDINFHKSTKLQQTINPGEDYFFNVVLIFDLPDNGPARTGLFLKGKELFYRVSIAPYGSKIISCGEIVI